MRLTSRTLVPVGAVVGLLAGVAAAGPGSALLAGARLMREAARLAPSLPAVLAAPPITMTRGVVRPWRVGIQAGHWKITELPDEETRLRGSTGTRWRSIAEVDVNLRIAEDVADDLRAAGVAVDLLPATVPVDYDADAFVAIHADGGSGPAATGWKIAAPRRSSLASRLLRDDIARAYGEATALPEDRYGVTYNMLGYYAFSWTRFDHAVAPSTPAAIIETGYLSSPGDRRVIVDDPQEAALGISMGILAYLAERPRLPPTALVPLSYTPMIVTTDQAALRWFPDDGERLAGRLPAGTVVAPVVEENGWAELMVFGDFRLSGWMRLADLEPAEGWS